MLTFQSGPSLARRPSLFLGYAGLLMLAGCQTIAIPIAGTSPTGVTTPAPMPPVTTPAPTTPIPTPTPTPTPPTTFSPALNASSIFIGASIINYWPLPLNNAGIPGQTSYQVLQRFPTDVVGHGYVRVIIQVGSNDILQQVKNPPATVAANVASMGQEASAANIEVVVLSLGPITFGGRNLDAAVSAVNADLRALATAQGYLYVDIFTPMQGHPEYFVDGLHPNAAGYAVIEKALAQVVRN